MIETIVYKKREKESAEIMNVTKSEKYQRQILSVKEESKNFFFFICLCLKIIVFNSKSIVPELFLKFEQFSLNLHGT